MLKPPKERSLLRIVLIICLLAALAGAGIALSRRIMPSRLPVPSVRSTIQPNLDKARELAGEGKSAEAIAMLKTLAGAGRSAEALEAAIELARVEKESGHVPESLKTLERVYRDFASTPNYARAATAYARALDDGGQQQEATKIYEEVLASAPKEMAVGALIGLGRQAERANDLLKARDFYRQAVAAAAWDSPDWNDALDALGKVNVTLIFSPQETPESKRYAVQRGDSITSIGNALNTTQGLLMRANGIDENTVLNLGKLLKYTPKDFRIVIERSKLRLFLVDKDGIFKRYKVGLGKPGHETTLGSYKLGNKEKNPIWHKPGAGPIPAGDPANELGTRWMPLIPERDNLPKDLGIHGTIRPETVGQYSSNGCARLLPDEIEELYDLVVRSTPVDIVETFSPDSDIQQPSAPESSTGTL
ncbi:MAG TPA: L,D-transpeptidase family protein [Candidatus Hydrogenedentes bacterium]|nr:L,D-transpeptidase family protein [Candidatus Hydrogenedentota bacterium]HOV72510.1 L,D-transpeptidase family protein [Candidatus Hydrogenedentota bacterium]HPC15326.1 L,D-transpeptidase family protein [Candidatus Hydrogenedentota bacterium]HRT19281.1 L,D-transpeptidase family protein [Candidatus Hydrogenedentota bacterium]HRT63361.1 L,D-transpeptidase family protein [Candidatus Hydrogenedentota bacterium]